MSAEESSPAEGSAGFEPENPLRTTLGIVAIALLLILLIYAYTGTRDRSLEAEVPELVYQERLDQLICCALYQDLGDQHYLLTVTRSPEGEFRQLAMRVYQMGEDGQATEVNAIGSPIDSLLPASMALLDDRLYVPIYGEAQAGFWTVDLSEPAWPQDLGITETGTGITRQIAAGDGVVAVNHTEEIAFVDLTEPDDPELVASLEQVPSTQVRMKVQDEMLYVNDGDADSFRALNVSDPGNPEVIGVFVNVYGPGAVEIPFGVEDAEEMLDTTAIPGRYLDFVLGNGLAFVAASDLGIHVLDLTDPEEIEVTASLELPDRAIRVARDGDRLYVLGGSAGDRERLTYAIHTVDVSDPGAPELIDTIGGVTVEPGLQGFTAGGGYVYAGLDEYLLVFDVSG